MRNIRTMITLILCASLCFAFHASAEETTFTFAGYDPSDVGHVWDDNLFFQRMEERTGISLRFQQYEDQDEWHKVLSGYTASAADLPDVLFKADLNTKETLELYQKGVLIDVKPYLEEFAPHFWELLQTHPDWEEAITLPDGAIVALPTINPLQSNNILWVNKTWLNRLGLAMPTTADEFADALRAIQNGDPNRNGKNDEVPLTFTGLWDLRFLAHAFGFIGNDYYLEVLDDGTLQCDITTDGYRDFLAWLNMLWEERLIDHSGFSSLDSTRQITDSNATITYGMVFGPTAMNMLPSSVVNDYQALMPMNYDGKTVYRSLLGDIARGAFAITSACSSPETILQWVDVLYTEEGCFLASAGLAGDEYERTSDGSWYWVDDIQTVQESVLKDATIADGTAIPIYMPVSYQLQFDDEATRNAVQQISDVHDQSKLAYPLIYLTEEESAILGQVWNEVASYAEQQMTWFVTGDVQLNDESWATFQKTLQEKGIDRVIQVFQEALDTRYTVQK